MLGWRKSRWNLPVALAKIIGVTLILSRRSWQRRIFSADDF